MTCGEPVLAPRVCLRSRTTGVLSSRPRRGYGALGVVQPCSPTALGCGAQSAPHKPGSGLPETRTFDHDPGETTRGVEEAVLRSAHSICFVLFGGSNVRRSALGDAEGVASSLDIATKLARPIEAGWTIGLYPDAAEVAGLSSTGLVRIGATTGPRSILIPIVSRSEANDAARTTIRRYAAANRLDRFSRTYAGAGFTISEFVRGHVRHFFKKPSKRARR